MLPTNVGGVISVCLGRFRSARRYLSETRENEREKVKNFTSQNVSLKLVFIQTATEKTNSELKFKLKTSIDRWWRIWKTFIQLFYRRASSPSSRSVVVAVFVVLFAELLRFERWTVVKWTSRNSRSKKSNNIYLDLDRLKLSYFTFIQLKRELLVGSNEKWRLQGGETQEKTSCIEKPSCSLGSSLSSEPRSSLGLRLRLKQDWKRGKCNKSSD